MNKKFSINLLILLALNLLIKPIYLFGVEVGVQNAVGAEDYGLYYAMFNFTFLFNVVLDLGINNFQKIKVAQDPESGIQNMATLVPLKLVLGFVYIGITAIIAWVIGFESHYWFFIFWIMINHVLSTYLLLLRANLAGLHLFVRDSILSVTDRLILVIGVGYLLWFGSDDFSIETFVLFQTASYIIAILFALGLVPKQHRFVKFNFSIADAKALIIKTWPFGLLILLMTAYHKLDGIMLERFSPNGLLEAGIYAQAFRILDGCNNFAFLYAGLLLPIFARLFIDDKSALKGLTEQAARFLIIPAGITFILMFFYAEFVMQSLYDNHSAESAKSLRWLMGSFVFMAVGYVYGTLITASANMRLLNIIAFVTVILNVLLNSWLIPTEGAEGAAKASFISLGFMAISQIAVSQIRYQLSLKWLFKASIVWVVLICCGFGITYFSFETAVSFVLLSAIAAGLFGFIGIDFKEILTTIKSKAE